MRASHSRFNRIATTIVASFAFASAIAGGTILVLHNEGVIDLHNYDPNIYRARFYVEDSLVYQTKKARGEEIGYGYDEFPTKDPDVDGQQYIFVGWDLTGEGVPDILPNRIYTNFDADAVFAKFGIPDIDWTKVDFNKLLDLLNYLNIDLESFMNFFGLTWEDLLDLLDIPIINYTTDYKGIIYLRNESFGDYNPSKHKWSNASYYPLELISQGSINPLEYTLDKAGLMLGEQANVVADIEYLKEGNNYPVMCYEKGNTQKLNSDSYSLTKPENLTYTSRGLPYSYLTSSIISMVRNLSYSDEIIAQDELRYRDYVRDHYLAIDSDYKNRILSLLSAEGIAYDENYKFVDSINHFFKENYEFNFMMPSYPLTCDPPMYFLTDAKVGIGRHFAAATTLIYRALGVPARYVQGYVDYAETGDFNTIAAIQAHSWCEIYVDGVGWMALDTALSSIGATDLGFLFSTDNIDELDFEAPPDGEPTDMEAYLKQDTYNVGDIITEDDIICRVQYDSGDNVRVKPTMVNIPSLETPGTKTITVFYHEGDHIFMDTIEINVEGGVIEGTIKRDEQYETTYTYDGYSHFDENSMFSLVDAKGNPLELREGDRYVYTIVPRGATSGYDSLTQLVDGGKYQFNVKVSIFDRDGNDVTDSEYNITNNYVEGGKNNPKPYTVRIDPLSVTLATASKTITETELNDYYGGSFSYQALYDADEEDPVPQEGWFYLKGNDFIDLTSLSGWSTLTATGEMLNDFDTDVQDIKVYRYDYMTSTYVEVKSSYIFTKSEDLGTISVEKDS